MSLPTSHRRRRRLAAAALAVALALVAAGCLTEEERHAHGLLAGVRDRHRAGPLAPHPELQAKAHAWAEHMAASGSVSHSTLTDGLGAPWLALGETVSSAGTLEEAFAVQLGSQTHRRTLLDGRFDHVGVGVARGADGLTYLSIVLMDL